MRRKLVWVAVSILALAALAAVFAYHRLASGGRPRRSGRASLPGLSAPVEVRWDAWAVPHVRARTELDLAAALGYLHANDRLTQMELSRRSVAGRLSEILGEATLDLDREARQLRLKDASERLWTSAGAESRAWLEAYARGVNAWLDEHRADPPPTLRLLGVEPAPWSPTDSLGIVLLMGRELSFWQGRPEEERLRWLATLGPDLTRELIGDPDLHLPDGLEAMAATWIRDAAGVSAGTGGAAPGRNNWALGPERTAAGAAIVANDPHLGFRLPGHWFQAHLRAPGFEVGGMTLPGVPGVVIGQSADVAWVLTNVMLDDQDLFLEEISADGARVRRDAGWVAVERHTELLPVRGAAGVELELASTEIGPLLPADPERGLPARSLLWTGHLEADPLSAFLHLARAGRVEEIQGGITGYVCPAQNLVVADRWGGLLYTTLGRLPARRRGDGRLPSPGWDSSYGWAGLEPPERNPRLLAPQARLLVTANHDIRPDGFTTPLTAEFDLPARADRIRELLGERTDWGREELAGIQTDVVSLYARRLIDAAHGDYAGSAARAWDTLSAWDGAMRTDGPAALFVLFEQRLFETAFADQVEVDPVHAIHRRRWLLDLLEGRMSAFWFDDASTSDRVETRRDVLTDVLARAWDDGAARWGDDPLVWPYGDLHRLHLRHPLGRLPLLGRLVDRGPFPLAGSATTVAAFGGPWEGDRRDVTYGPSMRWIAQPGAGDLALAVLPAGQSGHPWDAHYDDQMELYFSGHLREVAWSETAIERATVSVLVLE